MTARATTVALARAVAATTKAATTATPVTSLGPATAVAMAFDQPKRFLSPLEVDQLLLQHYLETSNGDRGSTDIYGSPDTWTAPATNMATATTESLATTSDEEERAIDSSAAPAWRCTKQRRL